MKEQKLAKIVKSEVQGTFEGVKDSLNKASEKLESNEVYSVADAKKVYSKFDEETKAKLEELYLKRVSLRSSIPSGIHLMWEKEGTINKKLYKTEFVDLTPQMAIYILANCNSKNRSIGRDFVKKLYKEMTSGQWIGTNGQSISINWDGDLVDGQHRLCAIYNSGLPSVEVNLVSGVNPDSFVTIDQGKKRSFTDHLQYEFDIVELLDMQKATANRIKLASSWIQQLAKSFAGYSILNPARTFRLEDRPFNNEQRDIASLVDKMVLSKPKVIEIIKWYEKQTMKLNKTYPLFNKNKRPTKLSRSSGIPIALMEYAMIDKDKSNDFLHKLYSPIDDKGEELKSDHPTKRFRDKFLSGCSSLIGNAVSTHYCYNVLVRHCMAHYFEETTARLLSPKQGGKTSTGFKKSWARILNQKDLTWPKSWE
tara:strand:- start:277 stop:1545 length:1269 start_codon:yes stop_codon:yes gene_type:complete